MARTAKQRAALRKAQLISARKRRGKGKGKLAAANRRARRNGRIAKGIGILATAGAGVAAVHYANSRNKNFKAHKSASKKIRHGPGRHYDHFGGKTTKVHPSQRFSIGPSHKGRGVKPSILKAR